MTDLPEWRPWADEHTKLMRALLRVAASAWPARDEDAEEELKQGLTALYELRKVVADLRKENERLQTVAATTQKNLELIGTGTYDEIVARLASGAVEELARKWLVDALERIQKEFIS